MASHDIYQFYAELDDFEPIIWRRFQVTGNVTVARLGYIIQVLFEMTASHLMVIEEPREENYRNYVRIRHPDIENELIGDSSGEGLVVRHEIPDERLEPHKDPNRKLRISDATKTRIRHIVLIPGDKLNLNYDFGDYWWVSITLEKIFTDKKLPGSELPRVLDGKGYGIVEDVGGVSGLENLARAFKTKRGAEYEGFKEWLGLEDFDIMAFDMDDMNFRLKKIPRIYQQCYEDRLSPTQRSVDLIERKYLNKSE